MFIVLDSIIKCSFEAGDELKSTTTVLLYSELHTMKNFGTHGVFKIKDLVQLYRVCKTKTPEYFILENVSLLNFLCCLGTVVRITPCDIQPFLDNSKKKMHGKTEMGSLLLVLLKFDLQKNL